MNKQVNRGIWRLKHLLPPLPKKYQLTLGEGSTALKKIDNIFFKFEFENPTGSVKDRGMAYQISKLRQQGKRKTVISSSGNAAISAASYCQLAGIELTVFISPKINKHKLGRLEELDCRIIQTVKPISTAFQYAKNHNIYNLRQSVDLYATFGFETIGYEIAAEAKIDAVFLPVSSGTTLVGIATGFGKLNRFPAFHAVQTEAVHSISSLFDREFREKEKSIASAIVAKYTPRQKEVIKIIKKSKGWGWVVSDSEMKEARKWLLSNNVSCSYEGAAALAALWKAGKNGYQYKYPVCILTGKYY